MCDAVIMNVYMIFAHTHIECMMCVHQQSATIYFVFAIVRRTAQQRANSRTLVMHEIAHCGTRNARKKCDRLCVHTRRHRLKMHRTLAQWWFAFGISAAIYITFTLCGFCAEFVVRVESVNWQTECLGNVSVFIGACSKKGNTLAICATNFR